MGQATGAEFEKERKITSEPGRKTCTQEPSFTTEKLNACILTETFYVVFESTPKCRKNPLG